MPNGARRRKKGVGEPYTGKPYVRFDEGALETCGTCRGAPALYSTEAPGRFFCLMLRQPAPRDLRRSHRPPTREPDARSARCRVRRCLAAGCPRGAWSCACSSSSPSPLALPITHISRGASWPGALRSSDRPAFGGCRESRWSLRDAAPTEQPTDTVTVTEDGPRLTHGRAGAWGARPAARRLATPVGLARRPDAVLRAP